jgi:hypothetical protein
MRHHVSVHASHREQEWESPSASLIEQDPEVIPDVDIAAQVGKDFFLGEKIPRHELGQGYVRVIEHSIMWRETETAKVFTYQGLTTCTELDKSWTVMSSIYNHLRQAMCAVVVSKTSCNDRNHRILRGVIAPHQDFFFFLQKS